MRRAFAILRESLALDRAAAAARRGMPRPRPEERAFLPAALEAMETPPSPTARVLTWTTIALLCIALAWSWLGRVDVVAAAEGRTVASGRSKLVQPAEHGVVAALHVRDGQRVRAGEPLLELDGTIAAADRDRLQHELAVATLAAARLRALVTAAAVRGEAADPQAAFTSPTEANAALVAMQRALLTHEWSEHLARRGTLEAELARRIAERATTAAAIRRLDEVIPLVAARAEARGELARTGHGSRLIHLEVQQQLVEAQHERAIQDRRREEAEAAIGALRAQRAALDAEFLRTRQAELAEAERQAGSLRQELTKAEMRRGLQTLSAPVDGVVQQLAVHTVGGVVQPAQQLMVIAPTGDGLEVEALVLNRDIGFVRPGQPAAVKLEAFPFTRFGLVPGEVVTVSGDAIHDERRGPVYAARVRLLQASIVAEGRDVPLVPGMAATAEIRTGDRRVIDYLLAPLARRGHEAMRER